MGRTTRQDHLASAAKTAQVEVPRQSLARWTLIRLGVLLLCVGAGFYAVSAYVLGQRFDAFEAESYTQDAARVAAVIEQDRLALLSSVADYAKWDDSYKYMQTHDPEYLENNLNAEALVNLRVNWVVFLTLSNQVVSSLAQVDDALQPLSKHDLDVLIATISAGSPQPTREGSYVFWQQGRAWLVALSEITDNEHAQPANGYMLFVRHLDDAYLESVRTLTGVSFELAAASADTGLATRVEQINGHWHASTVLQNLPVKISLNGPGRLGTERDMSNLLLAANACLLVLISLFGIHAILDRRVLRRLRIFSDYADRRRNQADFEVRWPVEGRDELDNLAISLNELIEEVERHHSNLSYLAEHDSLTDLGNRRQLMARLKDMQDLCRRHPELSCSLLLVDLDSFKLVNDGLGHAAGDWVLKEVATRIRSLIRSSDTLVRLGGDEFALLLYQISPEQAVRFAERMMQALGKAASYDDRQLTISASIGIAQVRPDLGPDDMLRNADLAMYEAKRLGKKRVVMFDEVLLDVAARHLRLEQALHSVLDSDALEVWFQPIVDGRTHNVLGMEALARWSLEGIYIPPDEFIRIAESNGMITRIGSHVLDRACSALKILQVEYPQLSCNVNLSVRQFVDVDLANEIKICLQKHALSPSALHLELTESMVAEHEKDILPTMKTLVDSGLKFHLDDFGTGYSSLERLRKLPIDTLKIDRNFVAPLNEGDDVMVRSIIRLGQELGMSIIAEGVETEKELNTLLALGCERMQGYKFARPMTFTALCDWLAEQKRHTSNAL
jgi:diguanylate cyclase (GGDEF)-like protein